MATLCGRKPSRVPRLGPTRLPSRAIVPSESKGILFGGDICNPEAHSPSVCCFAGKKPQASIHSFQLISFPCRKVVLKVEGKQKQTWGLLAWLKRKQTAHPGFACLKGKQTAYPADRRGCLLEEEANHTSGRYNGLLEKIRAISQTLPLNIEQATNTNHPHPADHVPTHKLDGSTRLGESVHRMQWDFPRLGYSELAG